MLLGSDCNDDMLRDVTGVKRGDTVGIGCMMAGEEVSPPWFDHLHHFLVLKNTALSVCEYEKGKWRLEIWNDHAHLG
jgi:hypothetical protein